MNRLYQILKRVKYRINSCRFTLRGNKLGVESRISNKAVLRKSTIGDYSYVAEYAELNCVDVGSYCSIGPAVYIGSMEHPYWKSSTSPLLFGDDCLVDGRTTIGNDVWIGAQSFIKQGVKIGDGAVIGAQSFVNADVPPYAIMVGTPARLLKYRFEEGEVVKLRNSRYWEYSPKEARRLLDTL